MCRNQIQGRIMQIFYGQLRISENVGAIQDEVYNMGAVPLIEGKTKRQVKMTEKWKEYKMDLLEKRRSKLVSKVIRKSSEMTT